MMKQDMEKHLKDFLKDTSVNIYNTNETSKCIGGFEYV